MPKSNSTAATVAVKSKMPVLEKEKRSNVKVMDEEIGEKFNIIEIKLCSSDPSLVFFRRLS